jgi:hypothetical protein
MCVIYNDRYSTPVTSIFHYTNLILSDYVLRTVLSVTEPQARSAQEKGRSRISILGGDKLRADNTGSTTNTPTNIVAVVLRLYAPLNFHLIG